MNGPLISCIIPTIGRPTLDRTLASLRAQAAPDELELLVVGDAHPGHAELPGAREIGVHAWGHPQREYGQANATGAWLWWLQDDDVATEGALESLRQDTTRGERVPILYRVRTRHSGVIWRRPGRLAVGEIDADCIVAPNDPLRLGEWPPRYTGDFDFIRDTVAYYGGPERVRWERDVIAEGRPR
jgi:hypothetical protein